MAIFFQLGQIFIYTIFVNSFLMTFKMKLVYIQSFHFVPLNLMYNAFTQLLTAHIFHISLDWKYPCTLVQTFFHLTISDLFYVCRTFKRVQGV